MIVRHCVSFVWSSNSRHIDVLRFTMTFNAARLSAMLNISQIKSAYPVVLEVGRSNAINQDMTQSLSGFVSIFSASSSRIFSYSNADCELCMQNSSQHTRNTQQVWRASVNWQARAVERTKKGNDWRSVKQQTNPKTQPYAKKIL